MSGHAPPLVPKGNRLACRHELHGWEARRNKLFDQLVIHRVRLATISANLVRLPGQAEAGHEPGGLAMHGTGTISIDSNGQPGGQGRSAGAGPSAERPSETVSRL